MDLSCFYIQGIYIIALRIHQEAVMEEYICNTIGPRIRETEVGGICIL